MGKIHSIESFGTVDGPGVRMVVFLGGCKLRCKYCHNPDTWDIHGGIEMTAAEIYEKYLSYSEFYKNGGVTFSGGEPLLQLPFLTECLKLFHENGIHTAVDTSGFTDSDVSEMLKYTDLVILDIKMFDETRHKDLTGVSNRDILKFAETVSNSGVDLWVRRVVVPGLTDERADLIKTGLFLKKLKTVKALDVLPYHTFGLDKYNKMGLIYPLEGVLSAEKSEAENAREIIISALNG
ncbi:MAG: pyruvate formate lyase-activating protein [Ruminococcus sp.]|jgi:pyruvate formate lyase activating enzyme|nr:pyruvate formate lyase-activating protein [Ruminococcus sp.]